MPAPLTPFRPGPTPQDMVLELNPFDRQRAEVAIHSSPLTVLLVALECLRFKRFLAPATVNNGMLGLMLLGILFVVSLSAFETFGDIFVTVGLVEIELVGLDRFLTVLMGDIPVIASRLGHLNFVIEL